MKLTYILVLLCFAGFVLPLLFVADLDKFYDHYGFSGQNMLARPYVLLTSIFMHGSVGHLLSNVLVLLFFGLAVEAELGWKKMLVIFFLGAFAGDLISLLVYPFNAIAVGASAGIFALIGVGMLVRPLDLSFYPLILPLPLAFLGMLYAVYNAYDFIIGADPNISYIAHFGGLFVGLLFGFKKEGWKKSITIIIITLLIMIAIPLLWLLVR